MTNKVMHKRMDTYQVVAGAEARCGLSEFYIDDDNLNWRWTKVTCKNCLKRRKNDKKRTRATK